MKKLLKLNVVVLRELTTKETETVNGGDSKGPMSRIIVSSAI